MFLLERLWSRGVGCEEEGGVNEGRTRRASRIIELKLPFVGEQLWMKDRVREMIGLSFIGKLGGPWKLSENDREWWWYRSEGKDGTNLRYILYSRKGTHVKVKGVGRESSNIRKQSWFREVDDTWTWECRLVRDVLFLCISTTGLREMQSLVVGTHPGF